MTRPCTLQKSTLKSQKRYVQLDPSVDVYLEVPSIIVLKETSLALNCRRVICILNK